MVSLFSSLNIASNALSVNESAISVVSHNVANMNTEGYSKQKVNLATRNIAGMIGNNVEAQIRANGGVMIANVMRYNNSYLNNYYREQNSLLNEYQQYVDDLGNLADVFNDLDGNGIDKALANFYEAVNNLNEYPASSTARVNFIESAKTLTSILNTKSMQLEELGSKALGDGYSDEKLQNSKIYFQCDIFNNKLEELAKINKSLQLTQTGTLEANNLLDKRDLVLNEISEFVDINIEEYPNGSVNLYIGDQAVVKGSKVQGELSVQTANSYKNYCDEHGIEYPEGWIVDPEGNVTFDCPVITNFVDEKGNNVISDANDIIRGGSFGGMLHSADVNSDKINIETVRDSLNKLTSAIANIFNDLNTRDGAYCINPDNTGELIATTPDNSIFVINGEGTEFSAGNISVNPDLLTDRGCWNLSCAYFSEDDNFDPKAVGNSQNVVAMLGTRSQKISELGNMSLEDFYTGLIGKIGAAGSNAETVVATQKDVVDSIYNEIRSNNSVDLNEELVDLVKYQTAYAASAQVFNVVNNCLDTLMRLGG